MIGKDFILAGDAIFTIEVPQHFQAAHVGCAAHYTFRVEKVEAGNRWPQAWFVKLLTGPDNTRSYSYLGKLDGATGTVVLTKSSKLADDSWPVGFLRRVLARLWANDPAAITFHGFDVHHERKCCRCGRLLTVPRSVETGVGPECEKIMARG